ncbi:small ribosomal subunit protein mS31 [Anolis carolinensis]|uniref:Small ribosomal subunit protein mS31 n=1 Tax=Anolis carolinensis TaxID=28377 RepID=G1KSV3_ANOCA|nr:PREDICTED: 28S ribosomal protein S31, mitochondrial [Anolis carolinensis]|eukprot:XP_003215341.1 PREDICTED: 28S ribosomal protein S31, mitochondrial [Anolis carolinensis]
MWRRGVGVGLLALGPRGKGALGLDSKAHKLLGTSSVFCTKEDEPSNNADTKTLPNQENKTGATAKKNLLNIISGMKVEVSSKKKFQMLKAQKTETQVKDLPRSMESASSMFQKATEEKAKSKEINPELVAAASAVASSLPFDRKRTVSELVQLLKKHKDITDTRKNGDATDISNIVTNMKIGKNPSQRDAFRASNQIQFDDDGRGYTVDRSVLRDYSKFKRRGIYSGKRFNIFPPASETEAALEKVSTPTLWDLELAKEIEAITQQPPLNAFEEMIQWTKEGKLWEFPINNEAGLEDNAEFHEHIFMDKYLEDFPREGPIRHFMELVTCGLSKNPYLSVREKVEHIEWFRDYFKEKEELLKEIEAHEKEMLIQAENLSK